MLNFTFLISPPAAPPSKSAALISQQAKHFVECLQSIKETSSKSCVNLFQPDFPVLPFEKIFLFAAGKILKAIGPS